MGGPGSDGATVFKLAKGTVTIEVQPPSKTCDSIDSIKMFAKGLLVFAKEVPQTLFDNSLPDPSLESQIVSIIPLGIRMLIENYGDHPEELNHPHVDEKIEVDDVLNAASTW